MTMQTFSGLDYLKIDIANSFGHDKMNWAERIEWFDKNESNLGTEYIRASEPALAYAGIKAFDQVMSGEPIGYMISLDATSSGLQILAALTGDRKAAELCNVVDTGKREDAYTNVYQHMLKIINDTSKISREKAKAAIMTSLYGSTAMPREVFGEGELLRVFYSTMQELAPAAWELNQAFLDMWDDDAFENSWVLPDNFHVNVKIMNQVRDTVHFMNQPFDVFYKVNSPVKRGRSLCANVTHSVDGMIVRELTRRCSYDPVRIAKLKKWFAPNAKIDLSEKASPEDDNLVTTLWNRYKETGYLSARILDHLHAYHIVQVKPAVIRELLDSLPDKPFKVVSIHDCFRCLPHYGNDLRRQYNLQLQLIAKSNLLGNLISQIIGSSVNIGKLDPTLWKDIEESNYALS